MRMRFGALLLTVAALVLQGSAAWADEWCYKTVKETVMKPVATSGYRTETTTQLRPTYHTVYKTVTQECCKPVKTTRYKEVCETVLDPVRVTCYREKHCKVCKRVPVTTYKNCCVTSCKPVCETHCCKTRHQVTKQICETKHRERKVKECVPVHCGEQDCCETVMKPCKVEGFKDVCTTTYHEEPQEHHVFCKRRVWEKMPYVRYEEKCCGSWVTVQYYKPGKKIKCKEQCREVCEDPCGRKTKNGSWKTCKTTYKQLPGQWCTKKVWQEKHYLVPVRCMRWVKKTKAERVPHTVCSKVPYETVKKVPFCCVKMVPHTVVKKVPIVRVEERCVTKKVPYTVSRCVKGAYVDAAGVGHADPGPGRTFREGAYYDRTRTTTTTRMVQDRSVQRVPVTTYRNVVEDVVERIPYTVCKMVPRKVVKKVPVTVCEMKRCTVTKKVPCKVCKMEPCTITKKVPCTVTKMVPTVVTRRVKVCVPTQPCAPACDPCADPCCDPCCKQPYCKKCYTERRTLCGDECDGWMKRTLKRIFCDECGSCCDK